MDEKYQRHNGLLQNNCLMVKCKLNNRTYGLNFPSKHTEVLQLNFSSKCILNLGWFLMLLIFAMVQIFAKEQRSQNIV